MSTDTPQRVPERRTAALFNESEMPILAPREGAEEPKAASPIAICPAEDLQQAKIVRARRNQRQQRGGLGCN